MAFCYLFTIIVSGAVIIPFLLMNNALLETKGKKGGGEYND